MLKDQTNISSLQHCLFSHAGQVAICNLKDCRNVLPAVEIKIMLCPNCKTKLKETISPEVFYCANCKKFIRTVPADKNTSGRSLVIIQDAMSCA
jgi:protein-arginine kinase activator protein McsA